MWHSSLKKKRYIYIPIEQTTLNPGRLKQLFNLVMILWGSNSGRAQLGGLPLIHTVWAEAVGARVSTSTVASSLIHRVTGLEWLTVAAGSWQGAQMGLVVRALTGGLSVCLCDSQNGSWVSRGSIPKGTDRNKAQGFLQPHKSQAPTSQVSHYD